MTTGPKESGELLVSLQSYDDWGRAFASQPKREDGERWMTKRIQDPGGANLTETISYHDDPADQARYGKIKEIIQPDGSWQRFEYNERGRAVRVIRPWKDSPVGSPIEEAKAEHHAERHGSNPANRSIITAPVSAEPGPLSSAWKPAAAFR